MINIIKETQALSLARTPEDRIKGLVAVHNGIFHADDVFFVAALTLEDPFLEVVRTRNPKIVEFAEIVGDVGAINDLGSYRFDHHQKGGAGCRSNGVPYAAFGLLWRHYGLISSLIGSILRSWSEEPKLHLEIIKLVDESLVQSIDAADCGWRKKIVVQLDDRVMAARYADPDYTYIPGEGMFIVGSEQDLPPIEGKPAPGFSLSAAISAFNPSWSEADQDFDAAFARAVEFAQMVLRRAVVGAAGQVEAKTVVMDALAQVRPDDAILVLNRFCPWQDVVLAEGPNVKLVVFPSETGDWRVQAVPDAPGSFGMRLALPQAWAGLRGAELAAAVRASGGSIGDTEAVFCHIGRFIGGATTFEGAMQMARAALPKVAEVSIDLTDLRERA